jgi:hypothetical protein
MSNKIRYESKMYLNIRTNILKIYICDDTDRNDGKGKEDYIIYYATKYDIKCDMLYQYVIPKKI